MTEEEALREVYTAYFVGLPTSDAEWIELRGPDFPCFSCEHYVNTFDSGRVYCKDVIRYATASQPRKTWVIREPCRACSDYKKAKGQTRMVM